MEPNKLTPIGWVARRKTNREAFAGHGARCKVYRTRQTAVTAARGIFHPRKSDALLETEWDFLPVYVQEPEK